MKKRIVSLALAFCLMFALCACGNTATSSSSASAEAKSESTSAAAAESSAATEETETKSIDLRIGQYGESVWCSCFDPQNIWNMGGGAGMKSLMYDGLFYRDSQGEYQTITLESYEWTDDTHLTCVLRDGIYFSDGTQLTGNDVMYSLKLIQASPLLAASYLYIDSEATTVSDDGLTINFVWTSPYAMWQRSLAFAIYPQAYIESKNNGDDIDWYDPSQIVTSGPYEVTDYAQNGYTVYSKRADWWGYAYGIDYQFDTITCTNYSDQTTMLIDLEQGNIDLALDIGLQNYDTVASGGSVDTVSSLRIPGNNVYQLVFDVDGPSEYIQDPVVREAMCYAIDVDALAYGCGGDLATGATGMFSESSIGYVAGYDYGYDPDYAKQLLADAGYEDGEIQITFKSFSSEPYTTIGEALQAYWSAIGIDCYIEFMDIGTFIASGQPGFTDCQLYGLSTGNPECDPIMLLDDWRSDSSNYVLKRDASYDEVMEEAANTLDMDVRIAAYEKLQQMWHDNYDAIGLYEMDIPVAFNNTVFDSSMTMQCYTYVLDLPLA